MKKSYQKVNHQQQLNRLHPQMIHLDFVHYPRDSLLNPI